jgi:hypothetical protein
MKLNENTVNVLKNFSTINQSILVKPGNVIRTVMSGKSVLAKATLDQEFPSQFAIYDISRFLGVVSQFDDPELEFKEKHVVVRQGSETCDYTFSDPSLFLAPPERDIVVNDYKVNFNLPQVHLTKITRALGVLGLPELAITGKGGKIFLQAIDVKGTSADVFSIEVGTTDIEFRTVFKSENIKVMNGDYDVSISPRGLAHFKGKNIEYWIAVEATSTYQE